MHLYISNLARSMFSYDITGKHSPDTELHSKANRKKTLPEACKQNKCSENDIVLRHNLLYLFFYSH